MTKQEGRTDIVGVDRACPAIADAALASALRLLHSPSCRGFDLLYKASASRRSRSFLPSPWTLLHEETAFHGAEAPTIRGHGDNRCAADPASSCSTLDGILAD